jgi:uncharacterized protein
MSQFIKAVVLFTSLFIGTLATRAYAQDEPTQGLLYEVSGNGLKKSSYIYGTFHLLNSGFFKERPAVEKYFNKTKGLVVEVDIQPGDFILFQKAMLMDGGQKISDLLTKDEAAKLDAKLTASLGYGLNMLDNMKPAAVSAMLSATMPPDVKARVDKYEGTPMDLYFINTARDKKKTVTGLETASEQIDILFGSPVDEQVQDLKKFVAKIDDVDTVTAQIVDLYFKQDLAALFTVSNQNAEFGGDMKKLLDNRNNNWMKTLPALMQKQPQFIAVGALHLAGPTGIVYQLRKAGYTVTPINN